MKAVAVVAHGNPMYWDIAPAAGGPSIAPSAQAALHTDEITANVLRLSASWPLALKKKQKYLLRYKPVPIHEG